MKLLLETKHAAKACDHSSVSKEVCIPCATTDARSVCLGRPCTNCTTMYVFPLHNQSMSARESERERDAPCEHSVLRCPHTCGEREQEEVQGIEHTIFSLQKKKVSRRRRRRRRRLRVRLARNNPGGQQNKQRQCKQTKKQKPRPCCCLHTSVLFWVETRNDHCYILRGKYIAMEKIKVGAAKKGAASPWRARG